MLRMLDRRAVQALREAGDSTRRIARQYGVSRRTIQRIAKEPPVESGDDSTARRERGVGRSGVAEKVRDRQKNICSIRSYGS